MTVEEFIKLLEKMPKEKEVFFKTGEKNDEGCLVSIEFYPEENNTWIDINIR